MSSIIYKFSDNMKWKITITLIGLVIMGCREVGNKSGSVDLLSPEEVNAEIESLREFIIPPKGESKENVDAVFGIPKEFYGSVFDKISADTLMYKYQLLTPEPRQEFRAYLYVKYNDDKVEYIGISHYRTVVNLAYSQGAKEQQMIDRNNKFTLEDLIEIKEKYKDKLKNASWNKREREKSP